MKIYETAIVIDSTMKTDEIRNVIDKIVNFISNHGGNIIKVDEWGKRRLAYEIKKKQYGYYFIIRFNAPAAVPLLLEREYRLNDAVLRYLTVKVDPLVLKSEEEKAKAREAVGVIGEPEAWEELPVLDVEEEEEEETVP
ncbi:MAG: 30S ribosomal protein S6 [candidate division KSB1 bacterium]|nr:30S ribosomal protein S6 [candidate division KSB1 bacterium]MDZ7302794.1 30S ribosomal protein S6 [candidate division KSB1 bacterium]MDZ7310041.1 30S ribosomal protein S6 [candidate division KSB1 bacterium]